MPNVVIDGPKIEDLEVKRTLVKEIWLLNFFLQLFALFFATLYFFLQLFY